LINEFELKKVPVSLIKFDDTNPNELSDEQMNALKLTMKKFGYLSPVILNKDFTVIDGEHRVRTYQDLEQEEIPAYVVDVDVVDQKILRQLMNKLHGEHDFKKDKSEFQFMSENGKLEEFSDLLGVKYESLENIIKENNERAERNNDRYDVSKDYYINGVVKQIILFIENETFDEIIPKLDYYMESLNIDNHSDLFLEFFREYERNHPQA
jgi:hypothetical protein